MSSTATLSRQLRFAIAVSMAIIMLVISFGWMARSNYADTQSHWEEFNHRSSVISTTLLKIKHHIGYGGFIHNFKNLVLRRDIPRYQYRIENDLAELATEFTLLDKHLELQEDKKRLEVVKNTIEEYEGKYRIALDMIKAGQTSDEIDAVVKVDDGPALEALAALTERVQARANESENIATGSYKDALWFFNISGLISVIALIVGSGILLTYLVRLSRALESSCKLESQLNTFLNSSPDAMISVASSGHIVQVNQMAERFFGYSHNELVGQEIELLIPDRYRHSHRRLRDGYFSAPRHRPMGKGLILTALTRDGREPEVEINLSYSGDGPDMLATITVRDVTERERLRLERMILEKEKTAAEEAAARDFLTGLNNRRQLINLSTPLLAIANRDSVPLAVAMLDIDHFKHINDTWGHDAGDVVLRAVADKLQERFRATDIVARFGGEEFCVVANNLNRDAAGELFEGVRRDLAEHVIEVGDERIKVTISIGVTTSLTDSIESMISDADALLYRAKHEGRNRVVMA